MGSLLAEKDDIVCAASGFSAFDLAEVAVRGAIIYHAGSKPPDGFLCCDGAAVCRKVYALLFALIGTSFGAGDGEGTFNLPDLRANFRRGWSGAGAAVLPPGLAAESGQLVGAETSGDDSQSLFLLPCIRC